MKTFSRPLAAFTVAAWFLSPALRADGLDDLRKSAGVTDAVASLNTAVNNAGGYLDSATSSAQGVTTPGRLGAGFAEDYANVTSNSVVKGMSGMTYGDLSKVVSGSFQNAFTNSAGQLVIATSTGQMVLDGMEGFTLSAAPATEDAALLTGDAFMQGVEYAEYGVDQTGQYVLAYADPQLALRELQKMIYDIGAELDQFASDGTKTIGQFSRPETMQAVLSSMGDSIVSFLSKPNVGASGTYERKMWEKKTPTGKAAVTLVFQFTGYSGAVPTGHETAYKFSSVTLAVKLTGERNLKVGGTFGFSAQGGVKVAGGVTLSWAPGEGCVLTEVPETYAVGTLVGVLKGKKEIDGATFAAEEVVIEGQVGKVDISQQFDPATGQVGELKLNFSIGVAASAKFGNTRVKLDWSYPCVKDFVIADFSEGGLVEASSADAQSAAAGQPSDGASATQQMEHIDASIPIPSTHYAITTNRGTFLQVDDQGRLVEGGPYLSIEAVPARARFQVTDLGAGILMKSVSTSAPRPTGVGALGGYFSDSHGFHVTKTANGTYLRDTSTNLYAGYDAAASGPLIGIATPLDAIPSENPSLFTLHRLADGAFQPIRVPSQPQAPSRFEIGRVYPVQNDRTQWHSVAFSHPMRDPIVVMGPAANVSNQDGPATVRVRNITSDGFEYQVQDWSYLDGKWSGAGIGWMAVDRGPFQVRGIRGFAGSIRRVDHTSQSAILPEPFGVNPVVLAQVVTDNDPTPVCPRINVTSNYQFSAQLQEEEAADGAHGLEELHFIALEPKSGTLNGAQFSAFTTTLLKSSIGGPGGSVTTLPAPLTAVPVVFGNLNSIDGIDTALLRTFLPTSSQVYAFAQEEQSGDAETTHATEVAGLFVFDLPAADARVALETDFVQDFETRGLAGWIVEGEAFSEQDITGDTTNGDGARFVQHGTYHLWGIEHGKNDLTGKLSSPAFTAPAGGGAFTFLLAGGQNSTLLRASLRRVSDDKELYAATGANGETYRRLTWDLTPYAGEQLYFVAIDAATGSGGHLNLDDLRVLEAGSYATTALGEINTGVHRYDKRSGTGYVMYSEQNLLTRFGSAKWVLAGTTADHLVAVGWDANKRQWYFDNGDKGWYAFTPRSTDRLVAVFRAGNDKIQELYDLEGQSFKYEGIQVGFAWANFRFKSNMTSGSKNDGDIDVLRPTPSGGYSFIDYIK